MPAGSAAGPAVAAGAASEAKPSVPATPPSTADYVAKALANIDFSKPNAVLYLRGIGDTSDWAGDLRPQMAQHLNLASSSLSDVPYANTMKPGSGSQSGKDVLAGVIATIASEHPQTRVYLAGVSLGAWAIGDFLLEQPALAQAVQGAALIAHTGVAKQHYPTDSGPVREFHVPGDRFSMPFHGSRDGMLKTLDRLYDGMTFPNIVKSLPQIVRNPALFWQFYKWNAGKEVPHNHTHEQFPAALGFIAESIKAHG
ncbi:MAG: hypothetical protein H7123_09950 [Thermoleophilia bacterium]|nr:hypothetical protein [Thermoleophilia bacterium]